MGFFDFSGRVALVTGASRGIGKALALGLAETGAKVVIGSRKKEGLDPVAQEIRQNGGEALAIPTHMGEEEQVAAFVEGALNAYGRVDIAVNNAATNPHFGPLLTATASLWDKILEVNLRGAFFLAQQVAPIMEGQGGGKILNVASLSGVQPMPGLGVYSVSKAGLIMMTKVLAMELGPQNIQVNGIAPGVIKTQFSRLLWETDSISESVIRSTPLGRIGEIEDVLGVALFLVSEGADFITGEIVFIDGGMRITGGIRTS